MYKTCRMINTGCECSADGRCFWLEDGTGCWDRTKVGCTAVDMVVVYGVAYALNLRVGRYPNGYIAFSEQLRTWLGSTAALTGTPSGQVPNPVTTPGLRVGLVEFTNSATARVTNSTFGAKGSISGDFDELDLDIDWHEDMFVKPTQTYEAQLAPALVKAGQILQATRQNGRRQVVVIFTDGATEDTDAAYVAATNLMNGTFGSTISVFGVQIDLNVEAEISRREYLTQNWLMEMLTDPNDEYYAGVYLASIPKTVLDGVCNQSAPKAQPYSAMSGTRWS
jgi:hypothetical protein